MTQNAPNILQQDVGDASGGFLSIELPRPIDVVAKHRNAAVNIPCYSVYSSGVAIYEEYLRHRKRSAH
jgi:hypothetical protein